jgi:large subunit ribosomal protein L29
MKDVGLREKNINELKKLLEEKRELVRKMRFDIAAKQVKNHREYRKAKKEVARILTILKEV